MSENGKDTDTRIKIDLGRYLVTSNDHNFILAEKTEGKEKLCRHKYFTCLKSLCKTLCRLELRRSDAKSIKELIAALDNLRPLIKAIGEGKDYEL